MREMAPERHRLGAYATEANAYEAAACLHETLMGIEDQLENIATALATGLGKGSPLVKPLWKMAKEENGDG